MKKGRFPKPLLEAQRLLGLHPSVRKVGEFRELRGGGHTIDIDVEVPLPTRARSKGQSASGVKAVETVRFTFPADYPSRAPKPTLRAKFPSSLPHINPHDANERVPPCISEGSVDELMHRFGFEEVVDQTVQWLSDAANGFLIKPEHGWEPTRRDDTTAWLRFDAYTALQALPTDGKVLTVESYVAVKKDLAWFEPKLSTAGTSPQFSTLKGKDNPKDEWARGTTTVFFACAKSVEGERPVFGEYRPDTVVDGPSLLARAAELGIDAKQLEKVVDAWLKACLPEPGKDWPWASEICFGLVLVARRPFKLVADKHRDVEFIPYVLRVPKAATVRSLKAAKVSGALHSRELSPSLLAAVSGYTDVDTTSGYLLLGCGSVGSKVAAHLGRAGFGNAVFLDNEYFEPHNTARHALNVGRRVARLKAPEMQALFETFGHHGTRAVVEDAVAYLSRPQQSFEEGLPSNCRLILDATASLRVGAAAVASSNLEGAHAGRYCRAMLYGQGRVALLLLEGPGRTPRCDDLMAELFAMCRSDHKLREAVGFGSRDPRRVFIGDNCASFTMPMSDSTLSRSTAMMAMQVEKWLATDIPASGGVFVGLSEGIGMRWQASDVHRVTALTSGSRGWDLRLSARVVEAIKADAARWGQLETGGVLLGHVDEFSRTICISDLVNAPPDSSRSQVEFKLGTEGLEQAVNSAREDSIGYLSYVGTRHTHPMGGKHSGTDKKTLAVLAALAAGSPMVSLVWTPSGFHFEVAYRTS